MKITDYFSNEPAHILNVWKQTLGLKSLCNNVPKTAFKDCPIHLLQPILSSCISTLHILHNYTLIQQSFFLYPDMRALPLCTAIGLWITSHWTNMELLNCWEWEEKWVDRQTEVTFFFNILYHLTCSQPHHTRFKQYIPLSYSGCEAAVVKEIYK